jgi:DNA-binding transcriptional ArsR family regulator
MRGYNYIQKNECNEVTCEMDEYLQLAQLMKTLAHPARLAILDLLRDGEVCVCHLEAALQQRQAYISQQLALLRDAGLVADRREGWRIYYHVTVPQVFEIIDAAGRLAGNVGPRQSRSALDDCPCPACETRKEMVI